MSRQTPVRICWLTESAFSLALNYCEVGGDSFRDYLKHEGFISFNSFIYSKTLIITTLPWHT